MSKKTFYIILIAIITFTTVQLLIYTHKKSLSSVIKELDKIPTSQFTINTDGIEYKEGSKIEIIFANSPVETAKPEAIVKNSEIINKNIFGKNYGLGFVERFINDKWVEVTPVWRCADDCKSECQYDFSFKPKERRTITWNQKIITCIGNKSKIKQAEPGLYRIRTEIWSDLNKTYQEFYSNNFSITGAALR